MGEDRISELEKRVAMLEFRLKLLSEDTNTSRLLFEYNISNAQYVKLMDLMDELRSKIDKGEKVLHHAFEGEVYEIIPERNGDYHFCEYITKSLMEDGRWEEVFPVLYGELPKYKGSI